MKLKKLPILVLSLILALTLMAGCGGNSPATGTLPPGQSETSSLTTLGLTQQTRVVLAEMFTGDW
jgi:hypothetical protein